MSDSVLKASILWHVVALLVIAIRGTTFVSSKVLLLNGMHPADIFFYRFALAYLCMCMLNHRRLFASSITDELAFLGLGIFGGTMYFLAENTALIYSTANNVAILVCTTPLVTALILAFFYRSERMTRRQVMWSLLAFVGMALVVLNGQLVMHLNPLGDVLAFGASVAWAFYSLLMKRVMGHYSTGAYSPFCLIIYLCIPCRLIFMFCSNLSFCRTSHSLALLLLWAVICFGTGSWQNLEP